MARKQSKGGSPCMHACTFACTRICTHSDTRTALFSCNLNITKHTQQTHAQTQKLLRQVLGLGGQAGMALQLALVGAR